MVSELLVRAKPSEVLLSTPGLKMENLPMFTSSRVGLHGHISLSMTMSFQLLSSAPVIPPINLPILTFSCIKTSGYHFLSLN